jgi:predicted membrane protein DUF2157
MVAPAFNSFPLISGARTVAVRWEKPLERWLDAGLVDAATAERIRVFEAQRQEGQQYRWPTVIALSLGGVMLAAGILLFVAAHWERLSPTTRFVLVLAMVALFHVVGALVGKRFAALASVLHAVGTACLGAGIFLTAQIFNLQEDWTTGVLLWTAGAALGWGLRRDVAHPLFVALLGPFWLASKWMESTEASYDANRILTEGLLLLAISYLTARTAEKDSLVRRGLVWIGSLALIPCVAIVPRSWYGYREVHFSTGYRLLGWSIALLLPLFIALWLRGFDAWKNLLVAGWVLVYGTMHIGAGKNYSHFWNEIGPYLWVGIGAVGLIGWGLNEARKERINWGVILFFLTVLEFYFSNVMNKLNRSISLIGLGVLFLAGGWVLEQTRRRLVARLEGRS